MPRLTKADEKRIVEEAVSLILEPANWITGKWKCEVWQTDKDGKLIKDEDGNKIPACDLYNRPLAQYCIEGAVNQASLNVLGADRAESFGVEKEGYEMTELLGLNNIARELFPEYVTAMQVNDSFHPRRKKEGHKAILSILQTKLKNLRSRKKVMATR